MNMCAAQRGRPNGSRLGESLTSQAIRYMREHNVQAKEAADKFGIAASNLYRAKCNHDEQGRYVGRKPEDTRSGKAATYVKAHGCMLKEAARKFGISTQAVHQGWLRLFPGEPIPTLIAAAQRNQRIVELAASGKTLLEICEELGVAYGSAHSACQRADVHPAPALNGYGARNEEAVAEMMKGDKTVAEVAAQFQMSDGHLRQLLHDRGVSAPHKRSTSEHWGRSAAAHELMQREGLTINQAARRLEIAPGSLRSYIARRSKNHGDKP